MEDIYLKRISWIVLFILGLYIVINFINVLITYSLRIEWFNVPKAILEVLNPPFIVAFFTAMYVLFTYLMFTKMREQVEQTRIQIKNSISPKISLKLAPFGERGTLLGIRNIGRGNAYDIFVSYKLKIKEEIIKEGEWLTAFLMPGDSSNLVLFEDLSFKEFLEKFDFFEFKDRYYSDTEETYKSPITIRDLKRILKYWQGKRTLIEKDLKEEVHEIGKDIRELRKFVMGSKNKISGKDIKEYLKSLKRKPK